jgi:hypothetical protein
MGLIGTPTRIEQWIRGDNFVVRVEVDAIVPELDPTEPCLEPEAIRFLDEVQEKANKGLIGELKKMGDVYVLQTA